MRDGRAARSSTYAVCWREAGGEFCAGELGLTDHLLRLDGKDQRGKPRILEIPYREVAGTRIGRQREERLDGRPTLVVELRTGRTLLIMSAVGLGIIHEVGDRLDACISGDRARP